MPAWLQVLRTHSFSVLLFLVPQDRAALVVCSPAALALAAKMRGVAAHIVMPENSPEIKKKAVAGYGAKITFCTPTLQARESTLAKVVKEMPQVQQVW